VNAQGSKYVLKEALKLSAFKAGTQAKIEPWHLMMRIAAEVDSPYSRRIFRMIAAVL
jgi:hypothetical protein